jgi:uncharacterized protein with von Willebrand factor type A (vWA) domain
MDDKITNLPDIHCCLFEDNSLNYELVTTPKMRPRTKHINVKYHHFKSYVERMVISVKKETSKHQLADILTKPLAQELFIRLRDAIANNTTTATNQADEGV